MKKTEYIGIDIGGTTVKLGIIDVDGKLKKKWEIETLTTDSGCHILPNIVDSLKAEYNNDFSCVAGIGMGVPGPVEEDGHMVRCVNLNWNDCNPAKEIEQMLGIPAVVGNDANVAAQGEQWQGAGKGFENVLFITLGTGVGSGMILRGEIVNGKFGLGGEIGHISVNPDEPLQCNCGNKGCLDQMASATGIVRNARRFLEMSDEPSVLREIEPLTAKDVGEAAQKGDAIARQTLEYCLGFFGKLLAAVSHIVDPEVYVIGGGVSRMGDILVEITQKALRQQFHLQHRYPKIRLASLGNDAGIYGAARMAQLMIEKKTK